MRLCSVLIVGLLLTSGAAWAQKPAPETLIFSARFYKPGQGRMTHHHLYGVNPQHMTQQRQLTFGKSDDVTPHWLSDGRHIVFARFWQNGRAPSVCRLDTATGKVTILFAGTPGCDIYLQLSEQRRYVLATQSYYPHSGGYDKALYLIPTVGNRPWHRLPADMQQVALAEDSQMLPLDNGADFVRLRDHGLDTVSPRGNWLFTRTVEKRPAQMVHVHVTPLHGGQDFQWSLSRNETLCWLDEQHLVGTGGGTYDTVPTQFFSLYDRAGKRLATRPLRYDAQAKQAAVNTLALSALDDVVAVPNRADGFLIGASYHRDQYGLQLWVDRDTGKATVWSHCLEPHFAPGGTWFSGVHGSTFETIGQRRFGPVTELTQSLYVARVGAPDRLISVTPGWAHMAGSDWRPEIRK